MVMWFHMATGKYAAMVPNGEARTSRIQALCTQHKGKITKIDIMLYKHPLFLSIHMSIYTSASVLAMKIFHGGFILFL
uniref:Uncharacterized protein n=1 Tax=Helianthus annuus TaxID=4232 RepID=A0A251V594_HELAN